MKYLIVNADDFGYSQGVVDGIIKAHTNGIVTSTSVLVDSIAATEANRLNDYPKLSVGLHFNIYNSELGGSLAHWSIGTLMKRKKIADEFNRQIDKFFKIVGRKPDHIDGHFHIQMHPLVRPIVEKYAKENNIPVRAYNTNFIDTFFGKNKLGKSDLKRISVDALIEILSKLEDGVSELMCHPGLADVDIQRISSYSTHRQLELETLTDKRVLQFIDDQRIKLISWRDLP